MTKKKLEKETQRLRLKLKAYDRRLVDSSCKQIVGVIEKTGHKLIGPIPLPTEIRRYTVNRSPFVHKDSREQFEMTIHKRLIEIVDPSQKLINALTELNLPAGVEVQIKMM